MLWWIVLGALVVLVVYDLFQRKHAILRNFPLLGHFRYLFEMVGPELRQYIVTSNNEERPFSRDERSWVYATAKEANNYFGFGTDNDLELAPNYLIIKHSSEPLASPHRGEEGFDPDHPLPCAKILGGARGRARAFRPASVIGISAMSYGSLSDAAITALNRGAALCGCLHNTGEGGISPHHDHGGDLTWQIGTGYFGCRELDGRFSLERLIDNVERHPTVRALEIKLSQGAKPGAGGILPRKKITPEIASIRGISREQDCISPPYHTAFRGADGLLDFVEELAERTGLPVGIKSAIGQMQLWSELASLMARGDRGVDFIAVDGGEGGTGAAPLSFTDHVALPFKLGFSRVFREFQAHGAHQGVVFVGSGRLGFPEEALCAFALGCDMINVAREAMMAIGCIQAQRCHTNHCPTGVATQKRWLVRGLDVPSKAERLASYVRGLRREILELSHACGVVHPALVSSEHIEILDERFDSKPLTEVFGYDEPPRYLDEADVAAIAELMSASGPDHSSSASSSASM
jgi:glutamate synthase (ferredoxin)